MKSLTGGFDDYLELNAQFAATIGNEVVEADQVLDLSIARRIEY
jgi:hypothetical protein